MHVEIARGNWKRLEFSIDSYNHDPERLTPKISASHVVNMALANFLGAKGEK